MKIFVYGTLKYDGYNHYILQENNAKFIGIDSIVGYDMFDLGYYPGITNGKGTVVGEVYEIPDLFDLDQLEGYPSLYNRHEIQTIYGKVWVYTINDVQGELMSSAVWKLPENTVY